MKTKILSSMAAVSAIILSAACNKEMTVSTHQPSIEVEGNSLRINLVENSGFSTRADRYVVNSEPVGNEATIRDVQLFIYDNGDFEKYVHIDDWGVYSQSGGSFNIGVKSGTKKVVALCNADDLSSLTDYSALMEETLELASNNDPDNGFAMCGEAQCTITPEKGAVCNIGISRYVAKVYIGRIRNNLPPQFGKITLETAYLTNVPANITVGGTVSDNLWYNRYGRKSETPLVNTHIIDGATYPADAPKLTYLDFKGEQIAQGDSTAAFTGLYSYPNSHTNIINAFSPTFAACCTKLVIAATICGETNYYSVSLGQLERNHVYGIFLTVSGQGSEDPAESVIKGSIESTITITGWQHSEPIVEDI